MKVRFDGDKKYRFAFYENQMRLLLMPNHSK